jgi:hypothetical protein
MNKKKYTLIFLSVKMFLPELFKRCSGGDRKRRVVLVFVMRSFVDVHDIGRRRETA